MNEVYVSPVEGTGKVQISSEGGIEPLWAAGGREILYRRGRRMFAVDLGSGPGIRPGQPRILLEGLFDSTGGRQDEHHDWDVSLNGQEIIVLRTTRPPDPARELMVTTGWLARLDRARGGS